MTSSSEVVVDSFHWSKLKNDHTYAVVMYGHCHHTASSWNFCIFTENIFFFTLIVNTVDWSTILFLVRLFFIFSTSALFCVVGSWIFNPRSQIPDPLWNFGGDWRGLEGIGLCITSTKFSTPIWILSGVLALETRTKFFNCQYSM